MSNKDFSDGPADSGILSPKEMLNVFLFNSKTENKPDVPFSVAPRHDSLSHCDLKRCGDRVYDVLPDVHKFSKGKRIGQKIVYTTGHCIWVRHLIFYS